jgi:TolB-like protein/class 3 adenylate cyclase/Tfp pilus assembly protein PilF
MSEERKSKARIEIGHVLFLDLVGYSRLTIEEQQERIRVLTEIVLATPQVAASSDEQVVRLPTGDGMALVFRESVEEPARCALEIARELRAHPQVQVRMGINSGPVSEVVDVNGRTNIAGAGINLAQRVMDCGDAGHILLSSRVAEDLSQFREWREHLHELGECEVKHGVRVALVNLHTDDTGNPRLPQKLQAVVKASPAAAHSRRFAYAGALLALLLVIGAVLYSLGTRRPGRNASNALIAPAAVPEKSVAVLPFENLSREPDNAFFAEGVQDEILTDLAKLADLKVISRTSTMQYKTGLARNLREIGQQLGVAHLLEGSVQRASNKVRVNAQLINARTDAHEWAEKYDRPMDDVFGIQSEIAKAIADQLRSRIAPAQLAEIERKPTNNLKAYEWYLRGRHYAGASYNYTASNAAEAIRCFREAVRLDDNFAEAWAALARALSYNYFEDPHPDPAMLESAREAAKKTQALRPGSSMTDMAQGYLAFYGEENYEEAEHWFKRARDLVPNDAAIYEALAFVSFREGRFEQCADYYARAATLNPRDPSLLENQADILHNLRRYPEALKVADHLLEIDPGNNDILSVKIGIYLDLGDLKTVGELLPRLDPHFYWRPLFQATLSLYARRYDEGIAILNAALPQSQGTERRLFLMRLACLYRYSGNAAAARTAAEQTRQLFNGVSYAAYFGGTIAKAYALEGEKEKAIAAAQQLKDYKDKSVAVDFTFVMAEIGALSSDKEMALRYLALAATTSADVNYGDLKYSPMWDAVRDDPRFGAIMNSLAPKNVGLMTK